MAFLDPNRPIVTCAAETCDDCPVSETLRCHFAARDLGYFLALVAPVGVIGVAGILSVSAWYLLPWAAIFFGFFGFLEIRVMCSHCPHYAEEGATLQCWANYGMPRLWKYRPGPMSRGETLAFWLGLAAVFGYPLVFLLIGTQWLLLLLYALTYVVGAMTMQRLMCNQCMNFACPLNVVDEEVREAFFERNPQVAEAWGKSVPCSEEPQQAGGAA